MATNTPPSDKTPLPRRQPPTGNNANWDDDEEDAPFGDPAKVKNQNPLESLGKAVTSPVLGSRPASSPDK